MGKAPIFLGAAPTIMAIMKPVSKATVNFIVTLFCIRRIVRGVLLGLPEFGERQLPLHDTQRRLDADHCVLFTSQMLWKFPIRLVCELNLVRLRGNACDISGLGMWREYCVHGFVFSELRMLQHDSLCTVCD